MSALAHDIVAPSKRNRSSITNSSWRLEGVDNRTAAGRRYRDLCMSFADDLGGAGRLSTSQSATIRQLAASMVESEKIQAAIVKGEKVDHEQFVRLSNLQARLQRQLGLKTGAAVEEGPTLASLLASREPA